MSVSVIENELGRMTDAERLVVIDIATKLIRKQTKLERRSSIDEKRARLKKSAAIMLAEYSSNKDLTEMTILDGEDFLNA